MEVGPGLLSRGVTHNGQLGRRDHSGGLDGISLRPDLTTIPLHGVPPSHVILATRGADHGRLVAAFRRSALDCLTGPATGSRRDPVPGAGIA